MDPRSLRAPGSVASTESAMDAAVAVSIVVPAYRAEATIADCLASLEAQRDCPPFEVIVVDSSPDERTAQLVASRAAPTAGAPARIERSAERLFPGSARNHGATLARGAVLLFVDSDCVAAPDLVARALDALAAGAEVAGAAITRGGERSVSAHVRHLLEFK